MEPTFKSKNVRTFLNSVGISTESTIKADVCLAEPMGCGKPAINFRNDTSRREFTISGLCQECQDEIFGS